jgi:hypothetical protein
MDCRVKFTAGPATSGRTRLPGNDQEKNDDHEKEKEVERRQTQSCLPVRKRRAGRATEKGGLRRPPLAGALACRRSTTVLTNGTFVPRAQRRARLPEHGAKAAA